MHISVSRILFTVQLSNSSTQSQVILALAFTRLQEILLYMKKIALLEAPYPAQPLPVPCPLPSCPPLKRQAA
jgi:hypothetical protein